MTLREKWQSYFIFLDRIVQTFLIKGPNEETMTKDRTETGFIRRLYLTLYLEGSCPLYALLFRSKK